jgi:hypothetical protein
VLLFSPQYTAPRGCAARRRRESQQQGVARYGSVVSATTSATGRVDERTSGL